MKTEISGALVPLSNADNADFGLGSTSADDSLKSDLVKYISGTNPADDTARNHMGDIMHSKPVQLEMAGGRR